MSFSCHPRMHVLFIIYTTSNWQRYTHRYNCPFQTKLQKMKWKEKELKEMIKNKFLCFTAVIFVNNVFESIYYLFNPRFYGGEPRGIFRSEPWTYTHTPNYFIILLLSDSSRIKPTSYVLKPRKYAFEIYANN